MTRSLFSRALATQVNVSVGRCSVAARRMYASSAMGERQFNDEQEARTEMLKAALTHVKEMGWSVHALSKVCNTVKVFYPPQEKLWMKMRLFLFDCTIF